MSNSNKTTISTYQLFEGIYHHASRKHLGRYLNEFTFRLNQGNCERHTLDVAGIE